MGKSPLQTSPDLRIAWKQRESTLQVPQRSIVLTLALECLRHRQESNGGVGQVRRQQ